MTFELSNKHSFNMRYYIYFVKILTKTIGGIKETS